MDKLINKTVSKIKNYELEYGDWDERIIWDDANPPEKLPLVHLILNKNDPYFVFEDTVPLQDMIKNARGGKFGGSGEHYRQSSSSSSRRIQRPVHSLFDPSKISREEYQKSISSFRNILDRFNLSNDRYYDNRANKAGRVRHTIGQSTVHHSLPALKLLPAYVSPLERK